MPLYKFNCTCGEKFEDLVKYKEKGVCPKCSLKCEPTLPTGADQITMETKDSHRGKKVRKGNDKALMARMRTHRNKYEMQDMIDKYGIKEAKKSGWLKKAKKV